jgi:hypothetical protein
MSELGENAILLAYQTVTCGVGNIGAAALSLKKHRGEVAHLISEIRYLRRSLVTND